MLVARLLATVAPWVRIRTSLKYKMSDISKGVTNKLKPAKKNTQTVYIAVLETNDTLTIHKFTEYCIGSSKNIENIPNLWKK
jgi:hypothetical protein